MAEHLKKQLAVRLSDEAHARIKKLEKRFGGKAALIEAALKMAEGQNDISDEELLAAIKRRLKLK